MLPRHKVTHRHTWYPDWANLAKHRAPLAAKLLLAAFLCTVPVAAKATTTTPLNTGYNHGIFAPYAPFSGPGNVADNYWINIASYPTTNPPIGSSWVLPQGGWAVPFPNTHWISAWKTSAGPSGLTPQYPAYTIFRKCFCLSPNFKNATLSFRMRADDHFQVWFNSILNVALPPTPSNHWPGATVAASLPSAPSWFKTGRNCIFVLLEETGGHMGFDLLGSIQADGLAEQPAFGPAQTFGCPCGDSIQGTLGVTEADQRIVSDIAHIAEERLASRNGLRLATNVAATPDTQWLSRHSGWWLRD